jgi:hypothetical protein
MNWIIKPAVEVLQKIVERVPPLVWAVLILGGLWVGSLYWVHEMAMARTAAACTARSLGFETEKSVIESDHRAERETLKDQLCFVRQRLAVCQVMLSAKTETKTSAQPNPKFAPKAQPPTETEICE